MHNSTNSTDIRQFLKQWLKYHTKTAKTTILNTFFRSANGKPTSNRAEDEISGIFHFITHIQLMSFNITNATLILC